MKICGKIIQERNIKVNTTDEFSAVYKKHYITIFRLEKIDRYDNQTFNVDVTDLAGCYAVNAVFEGRSMRDAIIYALKGALLI